MDPLEMAFRLLGSADENAQYAEDARRRSDPYQSEMYTRYSNAAMSHATEYAAVAQAAALTRIANALERLGGAPAIPPSGQPTIRVVDVAPPEAVPPPSGGKPEEPP